MALIRVVARPARLVIDAPDLIGRGVDGRPFAEKLASDSRLILGVAARPRVDTMTYDLRPRPHPTDNGSVETSLPTDPIEVVHAFLAALDQDDTDTARRLIADDIHYVNVSLPPVRGRADFDKVLALLARPGTGFEVYLHSISADGATVLTERTDALVVGKLRLQFWVWGRFDVADGRITLWRDSFDFLDLTRSLVRGLLAVAIPSLAPAPPSTALDPPGRQRR